MACLGQRGRPTGIDNSAEQLSTARSLQDEHDLYFTLIHGNAEAIGLPDASFDLAASEYGASIWADPYRWIPQGRAPFAPRRRAGLPDERTLWLLTVPDTEEEGPATERLLRFYFGMLRFEWSDDPGVEFHLGFGDWVRLLRANGFEDRRHRGAGAGRGDRQCPRPRRSGMGAKVACRADLEGPQGQQRRLGSHRRGIRHPNHVGSVPYSNEILIFSKSKVTAAAPHAIQK